MSKAGPEIRRVPLDRYDRHALAMAVMQRVEFIQAEEALPEDMRREHLRRLRSLLDRLAD